jgi:hypothetical protein
MAQVLSSHSAIVSQADSRLEPEFALSVSSSDVDVRWLVSFIGVEMEPERSDSQHRRHGTNLPTETVPATPFCPTVLLGQTQSQRRTEFTLPGQIISDI